MRKKLIPKKTTGKIFTLWQKGKNKTEIERVTGVCRKKVAQLIRMHEHREIFDVKKQKNWLIND